MTSRKLVARVLAAAALSVGVAAGAAPRDAAAPQGNHAHEHAHEAGAAQLKLDHGRRWATDAPLRQGMAGIRTEMLGSAKAIHSDRFGPADYDALAARIEAHMARIVAECKLAPEADEQLHLVLARLGDGVDAMKRGEHRGEGAAQVVGALNDYGRHFEHPGWKPIRR